MVQYFFSPKSDGSVKWGQAFTMPLGLTFGKTIVLGSGDFIDLSIGGYPLVARPDGAARWQLKLGFSYFFN
jgi:hypothetical protein